MRMNRGERVGGGKRKWEEVVRKRKKKIEERAAGEKKYGGGKGRGKMRMGKRKMEKKVFGR